MLSNFQQVFSTKKNLVEQKVWNFKFCDFANWVPPTHTFGSLSLYFSMVAEMLKLLKLSCMKFYFCYIFHIYMFYYIFIIYLYVYHMFFNFVIYFYFHII